MNTREESLKRRLQTLSQIWSSEQLFSNVVESGRYLKLCSATSYLDSILKDRMESETDLDVAEASATPRPPIRVAK